MVATSLLVTLYDITFCIRCFHAVVSKLQSLGKCHVCYVVLWPSACLHIVQSTSGITTLGGHQKSVLIREVSLYPKSHHMYYSWMGLCSGHGHSVVICELSLYPQLAKLTVVELFCFTTDFLKKDGRHCFAWHYT